MMKILISFFLIALILLVYRITNNEVMSTTIEYMYVDFRLEDKTYDLMLGSSTVKRLNPTKYLACGVWLNRGIGSSTISDIIRYIENTNLKIQPRKILLYAGENDISRGISPSETIESYKNLIEILFRKYPGTEIHTLAIKPSPSRREHWQGFNDFNHDAEIYAGKLNGLYFHSRPKGKRDYGHASFVGDGVHLTSEGYSAFTSEFNKACKIK